MTATYQIAKDDRIQLLIPPSTAAALSGKATAQTTRRPITILPVRVTSRLKPV